jgi:DNA-binding FrmR family transcriptional regulator
MASFSKQQALLQLRTSRNKLDKVIVMVGTKQSCIEILKRTSAVRKTLNQVVDNLRRDYLNTLLTSNFRESKNEIMNLFKIKRTI